MSHVTLFFGGNKKQREEEINNGINLKSPDVHIIEREDEKKSIGIDNVREAIKFLQERPFELNSKYVLIYEAHLLTQEAQNALLKTLEEPPMYADIRLGTKAEKDLLETVISRCKRVDMNRLGRGEGEKVGTYEFDEIKEMSVGERLDIIEELSKEEKETIILVIEEWIREERNNLNKIDSTVTIETFLKVREDLEKTNMNTKFLLEYLMLMA